MAGDGCGRCCQSALRMMVPHRGFGNTSEASVPKNRAWLEHTYNVADLGLCRERDDRNGRQGGAGLQYAGKPCARAGDRRARDRFP